MERLSRVITQWRWQREQARLKAQLLEVDDFHWRLPPEEPAVIPESTELPAQAPQQQEQPPEERPLQRVAGLDISFFSDGQDPTDTRACAALVVCGFDPAWRECRVLWQDFLLVKMTEPYIPGFLAFREAKHYQTMLQRLLRSRADFVPDVILVDGNGVLHPRGFGVASHIGVLTGQCTIGVAKNLHMVDGLDRNVVRDQCHVDPGSYVPLVGKSGRTWGAALLPQPRKPLAARGPPPKNPIFVSVGHRVSLGTSAAVVKLCLLSARVPEPVRLADLLSREQVRLAKDRETKGEVLVLDEPGTSCSQGWFPVVGIALGIAVWTFVRHEHVL